MLAADPGRKSKTDRSLVRDLARFIRQGVRNPFVGRIAPISGFQLGLGRGREVLAYCDRWMPMSESDWRFDPSTSIRHFTVSGRYGHFTRRAFLVADMVR